MIESFAKSLFVKVSDISAKVSVLSAVLVVSIVWSMDLQADWMDRIKSATSNTLDVIKDGKNVITGARKLKDEADLLVQQLEYNDTYALTQPQVLQLQTKLSTLGYQVGSIDGQLGNRTRLAIKHFQEDNSLAIDGAVSEFLVGLISNSRKQATTRLAFGRDQWFEAQTELNKAGFDVGKPDGIAGKRTYAAMNSYIRKNGLERIAHSERLVLNHLKVANAGGQAQDVLVVNAGIAVDAADNATVQTRPLTNSSASHLETQKPAVVEPADLINKPQIAELTPLTFDCAADSDPVRKGQCQMMQLFYQSQQTQYEILLGNLKEEQRPLFSSLQQAWQDGIRAQCLDDEQCALMSMQERTATLAELYNPVAMQAYLETAPAAMPNNNSVAQVAQQSPDPTEVVPLESFEFRCDTETDASAKTFCETASNLYTKLTRHCEQSIECENEVFLQQYTLFNNLYKSPRLSNYRSLIEQNKIARSAQAMRSVSSVSESGSLIFGLWYGNLSCSLRRKTHEMELEIVLKQPRDGVFELQLTANNANSMSSGTSEVWYVGEPAASTQGEIRFVPVKTVRGALSGMKLGPFTFDTVNGSGVFDEQGCKPLKLVIQEGSSERMSPSIAHQGVEGKYWIASTTRDRCEVLIEWADRVNKEYPGRDFYRQNKQGDDWRKIKLFGDDDFIPVFGMPFDQLALDKRKGINNFAGRACRKDPFTQSRMTTYTSVADRVMPGSPTRQLTSNGYSSTLFAIRKIRSVRNQLARISQGGASDTDTKYTFAEQESRLLALKRIVADQAGVLWPSESQSVDSKIDAHLAALARQQVKKLLDEIVFTDDTETGLRLSFTGESLEENHPYLKYLTSSDQTTIVKKLIGHNTKFAERITDPLFDQVDQFPNTQEGLINAKSAVQNELPFVDYINADHKREVDRRLNQRITDRLSALVNKSVSEWSTFDASRNGVKASAQWKIAFNDQFSEFSDTDVIKKAELDYHSHRSKLLEDAFVQFEQDILSTQSEKEVVILLGDYLSWEGDGELPIALEYEFTAELAK